MAGVTDDLIALTEFMGSLGDAGSAPPIASRLNRLFEIVPVRCYLAQWASPDGTLRKIASRRCPPDWLKPDVMSRLRSGAGKRDLSWRVCGPPGLSEVLVCRAVAQTNRLDDPQIERIALPLIRQALERIVALHTEHARNRVLQIVPEGRPRLVLVCDAAGRVVDRMPSASPLPSEAVLTYAARAVKSGRGQQHEYALEYRGDLYDLKHVWMQTDTPSHGRTLVIEARVRESVSAQVDAQFDRYYLTRREGQIARLLLQGHTNQQIATRLHISHDTVKSHCRHLFSKLGIRRRSEILRALGQAPDATAGSDSGDSALGRATKFGKRPILSAFWQGRHVRLEAGGTFFRNLKDGSRVRIEKGAIGYCYAATNELLVGFNRDMKAPPPPLFGPARFDFHVQIEPRLAPFLSVSLE